MSDKTGSQTPRGRNFSPRPPRPDDRIFNRGYVVGGVGRRPLPNDTQRKHQK